MGIVNTSFRLPPLVFRRKIGDSGSHRTHWRTNRPVAVVAYLVPDFWELAGRGPVQRGRIMLRLMSSVVIAAGCALGCVPLASTASAEPNCAEISRDPFLNGLGGGFDGCPSYVPVPEPQGQRVLPADICQWRSSGMSETEIRVHLAQTNATRGTPEIDEFILDSERQACPSMIAEFGSQG